MTMGQVCCRLVVALLIAPLLHAGEPDLRDQLYAAQITAAHAKLQLNEAAEARRWLGATAANLREWEWRYLNAQCHQDFKQVAGDSERLYTMAIDTHGSTVATAGADGKIRLWKLPDLTLVRTIEGHTGSVYSISFSPDATRIASVSRDVTARIWNAETGAPIAKLQLERPAVAATAFSPDGQLVATCTWVLRENDEKSRVRGMVYLWDAATGEVKKSWLAGVKPLSSIRFTPEGGRILAGSWGFDVYSIDPTSDGEPAVLTAPDDGAYRAIDTLAVSADGQFLAAGCRDDACRIWDLHTAKFVTALRGHGGFVYAASFSPDGRFLATGSHDQAIRIWSVSDWKEQLVLRGHAGGLRGIEWTADGKHLLSVADDGVLRMWQADPKVHKPLEMHPPEMGTYATVFLPDGRRILTAHYDGHIRAWNSYTGAMVADWVAHQGSSCNMLGASGDGQRVVSCSWDQHVKVWDVDTHALVASRDLGEGVSDCELSQDGQWVAAALAGPHANDVQLWHVGTNGETAVRALAGHASVVGAVAFSPDGATLASADGEGAIRLWRVASGELVATLSGHKRTVSTLAFSRDGARLASGGADGSVRLWDVAKGDQIQELANLQEAVNRVAFNPSGSRVVAVGDRLTLLDANNGGAILQFKPFPDSAWDTMFSPDGARLAICSTEGTIRILDVASPTDRLAQFAGSTPSTEPVVEASATPAPREPGERGSW
jgi:WD40 repeat protein